MNQSHIMWQYVAKVAGAFTLSTDSLTILRKYLKLKKQSAHLDIIGKCV